MSATYVDRVHQVLDGIPDDATPEITLATYILMYKFDRFSGSGVTFTAQETLPVFYVREFADDELVAIHRAGLELITRSDPPTHYVRLVTGTHLAIRSVIFEIPENWHRSWLNHLVSPETLVTQVEMERP
jgi:hypothetical protein